MIQQLAFSFDEIQFGPNSTEDEREAIFAVLQQASNACKLITRACTVATNCKLPLPKSPEALMSFMLYETQLHESMALNFYETMTNNEKTLDLQATSCLAKIWEYIALLRKFVNQLYALKVAPEQISWEIIIEEQQEGGKKHVHNFSFALTGSIGVIHEQYAKAYSCAVEAMEPLVKQLEASTIEGVSYVLIIDRNITLN